MRISPLGLVLLMFLAVGVVLVFAASGTAATVGWIVALVALLLMVGDQLPAGLAGGSRGIRRSAADDSTPAPDNVDKAAQPSEDAWRREEQLYRERDQKDR
jgi:hypothetical protein